jgi:hypothetical protein
MHRLSWPAYAMLADMAKSGGSIKKQPQAARAKRARSVSDLVPEIARAAFRRFGFVQSSVVSRWPEIVGDRYATISSPESIRFPHGKKSEGVLTLIVEGAHAPMMQHVAPVIAERVNRFFGYKAVERIAFRQGNVRAGKAKPRVAPPSLKPISAELGESLRGIVDPELRACLESLARGVAAGEGPPVPAGAAAIPVIGRIGGENKK